MFYAVPEGMGLSALAVLGADLNFAVPNWSFFAEMPALRELFLFQEGIFTDTAALNVSERREGPQVGSAFL